VPEPSDGSLNIYAYIDLNHAVDLDAMRPVPANATLKMLRCIFGSHIMQLAVAMSSMESENMDLCFGTCETLGLNIAITNLGYAKQKLSQSIKTISQRYTSV